MIAEIIENLLSSYPDLYFVFAGADKQYGGQSVMQYVWEKAGRYRNRVIYVGVLPREYLYPIIKNAVGIVLPSLIENFPNACLEAMSMGKVVIGTRGSSMEEMITDGENGFLCEINDPVSLRKRIDDLLRLSPERKQRMEQNARHFSEQMRPDITVHELLRYYEKVRRETTHEPFC